MFVCIICRFLLLWVCSVYSCGRNVGSTLFFNVSTHADSGRGNLRCQVHGLFLHLITDLRASCMNDLHLCRRSDFKETPRVVATKAESFVTAESVGCCVLLYVWRNNHMIECVSLDSGKWVRVLVASSFWWSCSVPSKMSCLCVLPSDVLFHQCFYIFPFASMMFGFSSTREYTSHFDIPNLH